VTEENCWSISELIARYELEPELLDVFVEGTLDREILAQTVTGSQETLAFYEIDSVNVPVAVLTKYGLSSGNKQRVLALSKELTNLPHNAKVLCLADRDLDHWFGELQATQRLRWTVYCSIECHFLTQQTVSDILVTAGRVKIKKFETFVASLTHTLQVLFALRLADRQLNLSLKWVAHKKYLSRTEDSVVFDVDKYIIAVLSRNAQTARRTDFLESYKVWLQKFNCDIRFAARGHDYTDLLAWAIAEFGGQKELANPATVERLFVLLARSVVTLSTELQ